MTSKAATALEIFNSYMGEEEGIGEWFVVDQDRISLFISTLKRLQSFRLIKLPSPTVF